MFNKENILCFEVVVDCCLFVYLPFYWSSADQLALPTHVQTWGGKLSGEGREGRRGEEGRRREREWGEGEGRGEERVRGGSMLDWCLPSRLRGSAPSSNKR